MSLEISVNNQKYDGFITAIVSRSLDTISGAFSFTTSTLSGDYPLKKGDLIQIYVDNQIVLTGYIYRISVRGSKDGTTVTISGRDITGDLIDSSVPASARNQKGDVPMVRLCETVISGLGLDIKVVDEIGDIKPFGNDDIEAANTGGNCADFLLSFARKRQVYLKTSPAGELVLFRPSGKIASTRLQNIPGNPHNNMVVSAFEDNSDERFYKYIVRSQDNPAASSSMFTDSAAVNRIGEAFDHDIRPGRIYEEIASESLTKDECKQRATELANLRRTQGVKYTVNLDGLTQSDGNLWGLGEWLIINDKDAHMEGYFTIRSWKLTADVQGGENSELILALPDAFQVRDMDAALRRKVQSGAGFVVDAPF